MTRSPDGTDGVGMTDTASLVERLNARKWRNSPAGAQQCRSFINPDGPEAAAALTARDDEIARLREALESIRRKAIAHGVQPYDGYAEIQTIACDALNTALSTTPTMSAEESRTPPHDTLLQLLREAWERRAGTCVATGDELPHFKVWFNSLGDAHAFDREVRAALSNEGTER